MHFRVWLLPRSIIQTQMGRNVGNTNLVEVASDSSRPYPSLEFDWLPNSRSTLATAALSPVVVVATILSIFDEAAFAYVISKIGHGSWRAAYVSPCTMTM